MIDVLKTTKFVINHSTLVNIDKSAIDKFVSEVKTEDLQFSELSLSRNKWKLDDLIQVIFVFNTINFCYWAKKGELKWTVNIDGEQIDGATALFRCLESEVPKNLLFLTGSYLAKLSRQELNRILKGNVQIPLFVERLNNLNEAGRVLESKFNNSFLNVFAAARGDALYLADILVSNFPCFDDTSKYLGKNIGFYKRAQLNSKGISDALSANGKNELKNMDKLTAFVDYKIPQNLRSLGILQYANKLSVKIDSFTLIEKGSTEEVEIRASTIWAIEEIRRRLITKYPFVTAPLIDGLLWSRSQIKKANDKPYHRTLTTAY